MKPPFFFLLLVVITPCFAQSVSWIDLQIKDYIAQKHYRLQEPLFEDVKEDVKKDAGLKNNVVDSASSNTGLPSFGHRLNSSLDDFSPLLQTFVSSKTVAEDGKSLAVQLSSLSVFNVPLKLSGVIYEPEPNEGLLESAALDQRESLSTAVKERFNDFDDWAFTFTWSLNNRRFGRRVRTDKLDAIIEGVFYDNIGKLPVDPDKALNKYLIDLKDVIVDKKFSELSEIERQLLKNDIDQHLVDQLNLTKKFQEEWLKDDLAAFKVLFSNQPQLNFSGTFRKRDACVGPDQWQVSGTYELSWSPNWNKFLVYAEKKKKEEGKEIGAAWVDYRKQIINSANTNQRFVIAADWTHIKAYDVTLADVGGLTESIHYQEAEDDRLTLSLVYGRNLAVREGRAVSRLDISASYEDFSLDETKNDRGVVTVTYTHEINPTLYLPISVEYANHPVYKTEPDVDLGLHFGLSYKLDRR